MEKPIYADAVTLARMEVTSLLEDIPRWSFTRRHERAALDAMVKQFDHIMEVDEKHALSDIIKMVMGAKMFLNDDDELTKVIMRMMLDIGKKMGPGEEIGIEFPLN